jgi:hypothetical protein
LLILFSLDADAAAPLIASFMIALPRWLYVSLALVVAASQAIVGVLAFIKPESFVFAVFLTVLVATAAVLTISICVGKGHRGLRACLAMGLLWLVGLWFTGWYEVMHGD